MDLGFRGRWVFEFGGQPAVRQFHLVLDNIMRPCLKDKTNKTPNGMCIGCAYSKMKTGFMKGQN